ncbi:MarR family winged helix-turn-helix transcriptional regulator [Flavobacterium sp.]|jgi:DNA-binding MarR family transcriptional regulator|uniref:MarR family winged helix-turn-helix transcriptional regulator n=1 Tax=Flavobacterium sp. TaxID=239 RepID=UPI0025C12C8A|nr:MarR family transcriptional regulator [Flavobacterium sp.]
MKIEAIIKSTTAISLEKKTMLNLIYTQHLISEKFSELLKKHDLSSEQYNVLRILRGQKGNPANMCMIQERMIAKTSNTTRLVDKLVSKEMVIRKVCPENKRKMEVTITEKGMNVLEILDPIVIDFENQFTQNLTQIELETINELLEKLRN